MLLHNHKHNIHTVVQLSNTDQCLAGTQEIPLAGLHMGDLLPSSSLPKKYVAFGHSFRTEAGSGGLATKGIYRLHQFSKVELFAYSSEEHSLDMHNELVEAQIDLYTQLGLHFRVLEMPTMELGAPAFRKVDIEAWMPGRDGYGEVSIVCFFFSFFFFHFGAMNQPSNPCSPIPNHASYKKYPNTISLHRSQVPRTALISRVVASTSATRTQKATTASSTRSTQQVVRCRE